VPDLPQGTAHLGVVGIRWPPGRRLRFGPYRRGVGLAGVPIRRVFGPCSGGMPHLQLESLGEVVCARGSPPSQGIAWHTDGARSCAHGEWI